MKFMIKKKRKKILGMVAVTLGLGILAGGSGCTFLAATTEEDIYRALMGASKDLLTDTQTITYEMTIQSNIKTTSASPYLVESTIKYSAQPRKDRMFMTIKSTVATGSQRLKGEAIVKLAKGDSGYYLYQEKPDNVYGMYYRISDLDAERMMSLQALSYFSETDVEELFQQHDYGFKETKEAYESVFAE